MRGLPRPGEARPSRSWRSAAWPGWRRKTTPGRSTTSRGPSGFTPSPSRRSRAGCSTAAAGPITSPTPPGWPWPTSRPRSMLDPDQSDALNGRGLARIRLGQWRPAVADAEAAVRLARTLAHPGRRKTRRPGPGLLQRRPDLRPGRRVRRPRGQPRRRASRRPLSPLSHPRPRVARPGPPASPRSGPPPGDPERSGTKAPQAGPRLALVREPRRSHTRRAAN